MKRKIFSILFALVLVLSFSLVTAVPASAVSDVWVAPTGSDTNLGTEEEPFLTIQKGINTVAEGGTVHVAAGTYTDASGRVADIYKSNLTLKSTDGPEVTIIESAGQMWCYGAIRIRGADKNNPTTGVTIDGFTVYNTGIWHHGIGILVGYWGYAPAHNNIVKNCIIGSAENHELSPSYGIYLGYTSGNLIENNRIYQARDVRGSEGLGITLWVHVLEGYYTSNTNNTLRDNIILDSDRYGICVGAWGAQVDVSGTVISGNTIRDSGIAGIGVMYATGPIAISDDNSITGNNIGIQVIESTSVAAHWNNIVDNAEYGVKNTQGAMGSAVDATRNWWGTASGPEHAGNTFNIDTQGAAVSDYVDYAPWCDTDMTGASFAPVENTDTGEQFSSIQAAIDEADPEDTISVAAGTYTESVTVNKSKITLVSVDGSGSTIITPPATNKQTFIIDTPQPLEDITVKGFTLEAPLVGFVPMVHWGDIGWHDGIEIKDLTVQDVVVDGLGTGWGINVFDTENAIFTDLTIKNTAFPALDLAGVQGFKMERSVITNCSDGVHVFSRGLGKYAPNGNIEIRYSSFVEIGGYAIINEDATVTVDATRNYWGDETGPEHATLNPGAQGDAVSENVDFSPWLYKTQEEFIPGEPCYAGSVVLENEATQVETSYYGGWNTFSTPILLDSDADNISELLDLIKGSDLSIVRAQRFDPSLALPWVPLVMDNALYGEDYQIKPGEGFFIQVSTKGSLPILCSMKLEPPQSRELSAGWNLVGAPSYESKAVVDAISSLGTTCTVVNSPGANPASWSYPPAADNKVLLPGRAYWVAMSGDGTLMCSDSTPVADYLTWELNQ